MWGLGPYPSGRDVGDALEKMMFPTCVIIKKFVFVGQAVRENVGVPKLLGTLGPSPLMSGE